MLSLFVMFELFSIAFWEHKMESVWYLSIMEETQALVELIEDDVWKSEDENTGFLIEWVEIWDRLCL